MAKNYEVGDLVRVMSDDGYRGIGLIIKNRNIQKINNSQHIFPYCILLANGAQWNACESEIIGRFDE